MIRNIQSKPIKKERWANVLIIHEDVPQFYNEWVSNETHLLVIENDHTLRMQRMIYVRISDWKSIEFQAVVHRVLKKMSWSPKGTNYQNNQTTDNQKTDDPIL